MSLSYLITCSSMAEHDVALLKSLIGIVGHSGTMTWDYDDSNNADVVIVDTDNRGHVSALQGRTPKVVVAYASPEKTLIPNTRALTKPARARELLEILTTIQAQLEMAKTPRHYVKD